MANIVTEHLLLIPLTIVTIIIFSSVANTVTQNYLQQQNLLIAQDAVNQLATTLQQIHYSLNQNEITPSIVLKTSPLPKTILSSSYIVRGALEIPKEITVGRKLTLTLFLQGVALIVNKTIVLTPNTIWKDSVLSSLSSEANIEFQKFTNGTIQISFK